MLLICYECMRAGAGADFSRSHLVILNQESVGLNSHYSDAPLGEDIAHSNGQSTEKGSLSSGLG